jgi:hypothetical protein
LEVAKYLAETCGTNVHAVYTHDNTPLYRSLCVRRVSLAITTLALSYLHAMRDTHESKDQ